MKDYCTGFFESIFGIYIGDCCKNHDRDYLKSGLIFILIGLVIGVSWYLIVDVWSLWLILSVPLLFKFTHDWKLLVCISKTGRFMWIIGILMFIAVSLFGWVFWIGAQIKNLFNKKES